MSTIKLGVVTTRPSATRSKTVARPSAVAAAILVLLFISGPCSSNVMYTARSAA